MNKKILLTYIIFLFSFSCVSERSELAQTETEINLVSNLYIGMDAETTPGRNIYQVMERDSSTLLAFFNPLNYSVYVYDLSTRELMSKTQFEKDGPDGLGGSVFYFEIVNDSTFAFHSYSRAELILTTTQGKVTVRHKLRTKDFNHTPFSQSYNPFIIMGADAYFYAGDISAGGQVIKDLPMVLKYGLEDSSKSDTGIRLAQFYQTSMNRHFPGDLSKAFLGVNQEDNLLLASFPLDDSIRVLDSDGAIRKKYFGLTGFKVKESLKNQYDPSDPMMQLKDIMRFAHYGTIKYDPYRELYLRTHFAAIPDEQLDENRFPLDTRILVADGDLEVLGVANSSMLLDNVLFSRKGLLELAFVATQEDSLWIRVYNYGF